MKRARNKFQTIRKPTRSQQKRDELQSNLLILQQLIIGRLSTLIDMAEALQTNGMPET